MDLDLFNDVNTLQLTNAISNCKNAVNYSKLNEILQISDNTWQALSKKTLQDAVKKLTEKYDDLTNKLEFYTQIISLIGNYKSISDETKNYEEELNFVSEEETSRKQTLQTQINNNYQRLRQLLNQITNIIG